MADPDWSEVRIGARADAAFAAARAGDPAPLQALLHGLLEALQVDLLDRLMPEALPLLTAAAPSLPAERWEALWWDATRWCAADAVLHPFLDRVEALFGAHGLWRAMADATRRRLEFGRALAARGLDRVPLLSLGTDCMAFDLPQRFRFGLRQGGRPLFSPFALGAHRPEVVLRALEAGWEGYAPAEALMLLRSAQGVPMVARRDGWAVWNHHCGEHWAEDGFARFRASIASLAARFDTALAGSDAPIAVFVVSSQHPFVPEREGPLLARMLRALERRGGPVPHLVALHTPREPGPLAAAPEGWRVEDRFAAFELPIPRPNYVWWHDQHHALPDGLEFELRIAGWLADAIAGWQARHAAAAA
ncbi:hypothetical protein [Paracraurococcus ruber]|uniref:Uncharacterized protein n=1 Tax=Paracraurococcus ruber TaxID=77675 RepID=A0ABS1D3F3_9PROT|nr:hypothetical protein [Paracraurococcus ruber]MBK1661334.1 hypothetical protein [Paracraurococcus ruber]TDG22554.1 hypothetical protein E2C05_26660 [Paracraurococcus ruber]